MAEEVYMIDKSWALIDHIYNFYYYDKVIKGWLNLSSFSNILVTQP